MSYYMSKSPCRTNYFNWSTKSAQNEIVYVRLFLGYIGHVLRNEILCMNMCCKHGVVLVKTQRTKRTKIEDTIFQFFVKISIF